MCKRFTCLRVRSSVQARLKPEIFIHSSSLSYPYTSTALLPKPSHSRKSKGVTFQNYWYDNTTRVSIQN